MDRGQADIIPHVNQKGRENFLHYIYAGNNKAFAIAPGGSWAWTELEISETEAQRIALQRCQSNNQQSCVLYALNDKVIFDKQAWPKLWRLDKQNNPESDLISRGSHFPNLAFKNANGESRQLSDFSGHVILVHFWGSWCPPCMREMPSLLQLQQNLKENHGDQIRLVLLQVREPFSRSIKWAKRHNFDRLPLYDSGAKEDNDQVLFTADGKTIQDRQLARTFPTSYVLDREGRVLFSHTGPVSNWLEYLLFFSDALEHAAE